MWRIVAFALSTAASSPPETQRESLLLEATTSATLLMGFGQICQREYDVDNCQSLTAFVGPKLGAYFPIGPLWSLGGSVFWGFQPGSEAGVGTGGFREESSERLFELAAEARFHALGAGSSDLWFAVSAGGAWITESVETSESGRVTRRASAGQAAPMFGVGIGFDFAVTLRLSLGASLRVAWMRFADEAPQLGVDPTERAHSYGFLTAPSLTLGATWKAF